MTIEKRTIADTNCVTLFYELQKYVQQGWEIEHKNEPEEKYGMFAIHLIKDSNKALKMAERIIENAPPKKSRSEICADARAAKIAKKEQETQNPD
jgi:hypothetical protein